MDTTNLVGIVKPYVASAIRHSASAAAGFLVAHGVVATDQQAAAVNFISAAGLYLAGQAWSWWQKHGQAKTVNELTKFAGAPNG